MKDFIGNELQIGDCIAVSRKPHHELKKRYIIGFTAKSAIVSKIRGGEREEIQPFMSQWIVKVFNQ